MKVLHVANMISPVAGIINQMLAEQNAAVALDIKFDAKIFAGFKSKDEIMISWDGKKPNSISFKFAFYQWLFEIQKEYDLILLRYTPYDPFQCWFISQSKLPVWLVLHTKYEQELRIKKWFKGYVQSYLERIFGRFSIMVAAGLVSVTNEIGAFYSSHYRPHDRGFIVYPNGVEWESSLCNSISIRDDKIINLAFVASNIAPWHGVKQLLSSLSKSKENFILHVIGNKIEIFEELARRDQRVICHGFMSRSEFHAVLSKCSVGISSLGIGSIGLSEASPLKTREYLMHGLPVFGGHRETLPKSFKYYKQGAPDINEILCYARDMMNVDPEVVRKDARRYVDKVLLLDSLYNRLKVWFNLRSIT